MQGSSIADDDRPSVVALHVTPVRHAPVREVDAVLVGSVLRVLRGGTVRVGDRVDLPVMLVR